MNQEQYDVESAIEDALLGMDAYAQREILTGVIRYADKLLDDVKAEIDLNESEDNAFDEEEEEDQ